MEEEIAWAKDKYDLWKLRAFLEELDLNPDQILEVLRGGTDDAVCKCLALQCLRAEFSLEKAPKSLSPAGLEAAKKFIARVRSSGALKSTGRSV
uniref:Uncharacterized protein n=1 Tax=Leptospirillum ferriphilum TaxID=178606 RepID=A0A2I2MG20_9BACT